jgi:hypothetical protein
LIFAALLLPSFSFHAQKISSLPLVYTGADTTIIQDLPSVHNPSKYDQPVYTASKDEQQVLEAVTNLTLFSQGLLKGVEASFSVYNLFNEQYGDPGAREHQQDIIEQDGRTFWVKVKYGV